MMMRLQLFFTLIILFSCSAFAGDYPKPKIEEEMEEMGSLLQGEGLIFRPGKTRNKETQVKIGNVNKYLYKAALDVLNFAPIASADSHSGLILTQWYSPKGQQDIQFKIDVLIKDGIISPETIEVRAFERTKIDEKWSTNYKDSPISNILEDQIIRKARTLYQSEK